MILDDSLARTRADLEARMKTQHLSTLSKLGAQRYGKTRSLWRALRKPKDA